MEEAIPPDKGKDPPDKGEEPARGEIALNTSIIRAAHEESSSVARETSNAMKERKVNDDPDVLDSSISQSLIRSAVTYSPISTAILTNSSFSPKTPVTD